MGTRVKKGKLLDIERQQEKSVMALVEKKKRWSIQDKKKLLLALKKFGHTDMANISKEFPTKSCAAIRLVISKLIRRAQLSNRMDVSTIDAWLTSEIFDNKEKSLPLPQALKFISIFEDHPSVEESAGFDFRAAYEYLHRMTLGNPGKDLSGQTCAKMNELMDKLGKEVWPAAEKEIVGYLGVVDRKQLYKKCYPSMDKLESRKLIVPDRR